MKRKVMAALAAMFLVAAMAACGGGGGEAPAPAETTSTETPAPTPAPAGDGPMQSMGSASISGKVTYEGAVPTLKPISMGADPGCAAKHSGPVTSEMLVLGDGNAMANILVHVKGGLPAGSWPMPSDAVTLDQVGCKYIPHVLGVRAGQTLKILNSDGLMHNIHALPDVNKQFNQAMPASRTELTHVFDKVEDVFKIKCDVHPWMGAWVGVFDHPFFAVTGEDGSFEIAGLPAGTYEVEAWHERLPAQTMTVTVGDGEAGSADFTLAR